MKWHLPRLEKWYFPVADEDIAEGETSGDWLPVSCKPPVEWERSHSLPSSWLVWRDDGVYLKNHSWHAQNNDKVTVWKETGVKCPSPVRQNKTLETEKTRDLKPFSSSSPSPKQHSLTLKSYDDKPQQTDIWADRKGLQSRRKCARWCKSSEAVWGWGWGMDRLEAKKRE